MSCKIAPVAILLDEGDEAVDGIGLGDVHLDALLALVEADFASGGTHVAIVGIGHLTRTVDNAAHDSNLEVGEVGGGLLHAVYGGLQIKQGAATRGA